MSESARALPAPLPNAAAGENIKKFDPASIRLVWNARRWQVAAGNEVLKDFGPHESEARQAVKVIRELKLNQMGTIGGPAPVMEYWLSDGKAPTGLAGGLRPLPLEPGSLRVEQIQGQWCLRDARRVLFGFGADVRDARQALTVMQKYGFRQIGVVGQGTPAMTVFLGTPEGAILPSGHHTPSLGSAAGRQLNVPHFSRTKEGVKVSEAKNDLPREVANLPLAAVRPPAAPGAPGGTGLVGEGDTATLPAKKDIWRAPSPLGGNAGAAGEKPAGVPLGRVAFDWSRAEVKQVNGEWQLLAGRTVLARFGAKDHDARLALQALRYYRFTEQFQTGGEGTSFSYFTAPGQAPRGVLLGVTSVTFRPEDVTVQQQGNQYALMGGKQLIVQLCQHPEEARQLQETIRRHQYDRFCRIGPADTGMTFLVRSR